MSDPGDIKRLELSLARGWINEQEGRYCFVQSQLENRSPLDIALRQGYLNTAQIAQLQSPQSGHVGVIPSESQYPELGRHFDGFLLVRELGRGGMGVVYEGEKNGVRYALKFLLSDVVKDVEVAERFKREATALAKVDRHPNIARIHAYKEVGAQRYLHFDVLSGGDLKDRISREKRFTEENALATVSQLANGLAHIHKHGFLHRDLKPENILFDKESDKPQISDFGLAYSTRLETLTLSGEAVGTPAYMAPEQYEGQRSKLCPGTDVWALGAILYELLSGEKAFQGSTVLEYANNILKRDTPRIRTANPAISEGTENIILKSLEKNTEDRFQSAAEFERACLAVLNKSYRLQALPSQLRQARALKRRVLALILFSTLSLTLSSFGRDLDEYFFQARIGPELKAQTQAIEENVEKTSQRLEEAVGRLMLRASGMKFLDAKAVIPKDDKLMKGFDTFILNVQGISRFFNNPQLELLQQKRSAITHYWSARDALSARQQVPLDSRLSKDWRGIFEGYQLFYKGDYKAAKRHFNMLQKQKGKLKEANKLKDLCYLGLSLCAVKQKEWKQASRWSAGVSMEPSSLSWRRDLLLHIKAQQALELVLSDSSNDKLKLNDEFEQCWTELLVKLEAYGPAVTKLYWKSWNEQINEALAKDLNSRTILLFCDFLAKYWIKKPTMIQPQFNHKALQIRLKTLFEIGRSKGLNNNYGTVFHHFLSIRQFDRSFKTDLTFLIPIKRSDGGIFGTIETEMDWYQNLPRIAHGALRDVRKDSRQDQELSALLYETSLAASRQGLYFPLRESVLISLEKSGMLTKAVDQSDQTLDPYPLFWRIQLTPVEYQKVNSTELDKIRFLYLRMSRDIETLLRANSLSPRFRALVLRKKARWHYSVSLELTAQNPIITLQDLKLRDNTQLKLELNETLKKAMTYPHFRADKACFEYAYWFSGNDSKQRTRFFERCVRELEDRQARTLKKAFYVGRTLGESVLPVRNYKKSKTRYLLHYVKHLRSVGAHDKAIATATSAQDITRDRFSFEIVIAQCFVDQKRWSDLKALLMKKRSRSPQLVLKELFSLFRDKPTVIAELEKRFGKVMQEPGSVK